MVDELGPESKPSQRVVNTLKKLERPGFVLVAFRPGQPGAIIGQGKNPQWVVEKIPAKRIQHMVERGYINDVRRSEFSQLGWIEYTITYDGLELLRAMGLA